MKRVFSLFLAVAMLTVFAMSAAAVDSPILLGPSGNLVPGNSDEVGLVMTPNGVLVLQNSKGQQTDAFHVIFDAAGDHSFWYGGYDVQKGVHIDDVDEPVIKITLLSAASNANANAKPGDVTESNIGFAKNQKLIDLYHSFIGMNANVAEFVKSLGDTDANGFLNAARKAGMENKTPTIADMFDLSMNKAGYDFFAGETNVPFSFNLNERMQGKVNDLTVVGHLQKSEVLEYLFGKIVRSSGGTVGINITVNLMNLSPFMLFAEVKEGNPTVSDTDSNVTGSIVSPKTGDIGEAAAPKSFPWMMVSVLLAVSACGIYCTTRKER